MLKESTSNRPDATPVILHLVEKGHNNNYYAHIPNELDWLYESSLTILLLVEKGKRRKNTHLLPESKGKMYS